MFQYNYNKQNKHMYIKLPKYLFFAYEFLAAISEMIDKCLIKGGNKVEFIFIVCNQDAEYDKMTKAYLWNVCHYMAQVKRVKLNFELYKELTSTISVEDGVKFKEIDLEKVLVDKSLTYYDFHGDKNVQNTVNEIVRMLIENNLTIGSETVKEFLSTTIGEIFSNSINHSEQDEIFFMHDIVCEDGEFYLCINVIDYGTTIVSNVQRYHTVMESCDRKLDGKECIQWAIKAGHTTRKGSGGYGLPTLISYVKSTEGILYILSDNADYRLEAGNEEILLSKGVFPGTSITFKVKLYDTKRVLCYDEKKEEIISISLAEI